MPRPANATEGEILDLALNAHVTVVVRVRYIDGAAVSTATSVLPAARVPRLTTPMATDDSLDGVLRQHYRYTPVRQWSQSRLAPPSAEIAERLRLRGRPPQILLRGLVSCAESGKKLEYVESDLRPDVFDVVTEV